MDTLQISSSDPLRSFSQLSVNNNENSNDNNTTTTTTDNNNTIDTTTTTTTTKTITTRSYKPPKDKSKKTHKRINDTGIYDMKDKTPSPFRFDIKNRITLDPIGYVDSCFPKKNGTPRQGVLSPSSMGSIRILSDYAPQMLKGLNEYSHVWVMWWFHNNYSKENNDDLCTPPNDPVEEQAEDGATTTPKHGYTEEYRHPPPHVKVRPPNLRSGKVGVYACRTPHRMVPLGMTLCKIERITGDTVYISGIDMIHGTPVLDLKPHIPRYDSVENAVVPEWTMKGSDILGVNFSQNGIDTLTEVLATHVTPVLPDEMEIKERVAVIKASITEVLMADPRSTYRRNKLKEEIWGFIVHGLNVKCQMDEKQTAHVLMVETEESFRASEEAENNNKAKNDDASDSTAESRQN
eukprot:gene2545-2916_t